MALWRLARCLWGVAHGLALCTFVFPFLAPSQRMVRVGQFCRLMLQRLGIGIETEGLPLQGPVMFASNHISWLDILAINAVQPARFVSKADVRRWPLLGWMVACGGTLFIERERKRDAMRVVHQVAEALRAGDVMAMFPEGTTGKGHELLPFHANLLQAAIVTDAPVQGVALRFSDAAHAVSPAAAYVGDINLLQSLWAVISARALTVRVTVLPPLASSGKERRQLSDELRRQIETALEMSSRTGHD